MKRFQAILCASLLTVAMASSALAGTISTTGIISTPKSGIISTPKSGIISTPKSGIISTPIADSILAMLATLFG